MVSEEDMKILENAIQCNKKQFEELGTHILLQDDEMKALENLLQGYKTEKEQHEASRKVIVEQCDYIQNKSIPKSLVKEKTEEYKKRKENCNDLETGIRLDVKIKAYEELLKGDE